MRQEITTKQFTLPYYPDITVDVIGEDRQLSLNNSVFTDLFNGYQCHLYKIHTAIPAGDFNSDGKINLQDISILSQNWLTHSGQAGWNPRCDISEPNDGFVDLADFTVMMEYWLDNS
jgi:hypothetical protein